MQNFNITRDRSDAVIELNEHEVTLLKKYKSELSKIVESIRGVIDRYKLAPIKEASTMDFTKDISIALHRINDFANKTHRRPFEDEKQVKEQLKKDTGFIYNIKTKLEDKYKEYNK